MPGPQSFRAALLGLALLAPAARGADGGPGTAAPFSAEELIRAVARAQLLSDRAITASTFDQVEVRTEYGKDGRPASVKRRLFRYSSGEAPGSSTRELVEVDGRPATGAEKEADAAAEAERRERSKVREAEARAARPPSVQGDADDPLVGPRRLSDLLGRFAFGRVEEVLVGGRPAYAVDFAPKPGAPSRTLGDRALGLLAGRAVVDAADLQVVSVDARLVAPFRVLGGLAASVKEATLVYRAERLAEGAWLPCLVELRLRGKAALFRRIDSATRFEFSGYARFLVEVESAVRARSVESAP